MIDVNKFPGLKNDLRQTNSTLDNLLRTGNNSNEELPHNIININRAVFIRKQKNVK